NPIPIRRPKIVFVFAVAIIAGTISIGMLLPIKPFVALNAFGAQREMGENIYNSLQEQGYEVLLDDRAERAGVKFADADLFGLP
ncbi:His/Gly/Thr/Pro-type tRNA ligase C-terminal domain-containing protein, partial [Bacillus cereus]